jgi:hypothetical protein
MPSKLMMCYRGCVAVRHVFCTALYCLFLDEPSGQSLQRAATKAKYQAKMSDLGQIKQQIDVRHAMLICPPPGLTRDFTVESEIRATRHYVMADYFSVIAITPTP